ncbi:RluA family pseudouridine synthase [Lentilactobacillus senioris]|uniref:RluA family pseudouridine synthase n=1 Tax=Lentilactobacillus senioris TaxID=931534 RepID=UPI00227E6BDF|nr:RluA family pseudouridine synthase [Lentilactobacillus senioris]MCY9806856.1 RluA family pseudouridine synthase [Lentilactobacillus senioris]
MQTYKITTESGRIDKVAAELDPTLSRSAAKEMIDAGLIKVNDVVVKAKTTVQPGDLVSVAAREPETLEVIPEDIPLDIVYEDDDVIVVNKPQGMVVHPAPGHTSHTLVNALLFHSPLSTINGTYRPGIVHRIDKDTSGLLMVAKNDNAHQSLSAQLKAKTNLRKYIALVHGIIEEDEGTINAPLGRSPKDRKKQAIVANGREAVTHFKVLERFEHYTLIECQLETGRTHQIRVHLKYINHPIAGDPIYGPKKTLKGNGQFLHAGELGFTHPVTGEFLTFEAPLPAVFKQTLDQLRLNDKS